MKTLNLLMQAPSPNRVDTKFDMPDNNRMNLLDTDKRLRKQVAASLLSNEVQQKLFTHLDDLLTRITLAEKALTKIVDLCQLQQKVT